MTNNGYDGTTHPLGWIAGRLRCPDCHSSELQWSNVSIVCTKCATVFPFSHGRPVLIREDNALFPRTSYLNKATASDSSRSHLLSHLAPSRSVNLSYRRTLRTLAATLNREAGSSVLIIGAGAQKQWLQQFFAEYPQIRLLYSDVDIHGDLDLFCDAHDLPFGDETFGAIIASAVLEHVMYPERVAAEIHRVLVKGGLIYSEIPFLQQVHEGAYDFTRYTLSGHRRLFNHFEEFSAGVVAGPATTLAWAIEHFVVCCAPRPLARPVRLMVRAGLFWLKYLDHFFEQSPGAADGASCTFFFGRKLASKNPDVDVIDRYRGIKLLRHV